MQGKRKRLSSAEYSNKKLRKDQDDSEDTATEAGNSPLCHQDFDGGPAYLSIETPSEDPQTAQRDPIFAPHSAVLHLQQKERPIHTSANSSGLVRLPFISMKPDVRSVTFVLDDNDAVVQYLFEPAPFSIIPTNQFGPSVMSSNTEWEKKLRAIVNEMLGGVPLGEPMVSIVEAPFIGNQYAGKDLGFVDVSWQKCFL